MHSDYFAESHLNRLFSAHVCEQVVLDMLYILSNNAIEKQNKLVRVLEPASIFFRF